MIGIIGAMDIEVDSIKALLSEKSQTTVSGITFIKGKYKKEDVVVAKCGVGKVFSALCTEAMILTFSPDMIINVGVAGALDKRLKIGDVVIASGVVQHDMDTSPLGDPIGLLSGIDKVEISSDEDIVSRLCDAAKSVGVRYIVGTIATGDQFVASDNTKQFITDNFGAVSCEMEGGACGQVCYVNKVPFCVLRTMSDQADGNASVDFPTLCKMASENNTGIVKAFLEGF